MTFSPTFSILTVLIVVLAPKRGAGHDTGRDVPLSARIVLSSSQRLLVRLDD